MDSVEEAAALRRAAVFAAMSEKAAAINARCSGAAASGSGCCGAGRCTAFAAASSAATVDSRFARMGIVDDAAPGMSDLDAVLRRRRVG